MFNRVKRFFFACIILFPGLRLLAQADTCTTRFLLDSSFSRLRWPFGTGSWIKREGWYSGNDVPGSGNGWGQEGHVSSDFYALDWNNLESPDCATPFYAPIGGVVVIIKDDCTGNCDNGVPSGCGGYGNQVVILSSIDTSYAFRVAHLNSINAHVGKIVRPGDLIGNIGSTGNSRGAHAHCALYRNTNRFLSNLETGPPGSGKSHSVPFDFSAICGGEGSNVITSTAEIEPGNFVEIYPNPAWNTLYIKFTRVPFSKLSIQLISFEGKTFLQQSYRAGQSINLSAIPDGIYFLRIDAGRRRVTKKIIILRK